MIARCRIADFESSQILWVSKHLSYETDCVGTIATRDAGITGRVQWSWGFVGAVLPPVGVLATELPLAPTGVSDLEDRGER